jgi:endonuclease/exonuclease/phosphatase family metal-dependent hydrolase
MKLISLNVEDVMNEERVLPFLEREMADVVCLQETTEKYLAPLQELGYTTFFEPRCIKSHEGVDFVDGLLFASLHPATFQTYHYYNPHNGIIREQFDVETQRNNTPRSLVLAHVGYHDEQYVIGTTHFTWTPKGALPCAAQKQDLKAYLELVATLPPHIVCGDFNIPRHHNELYVPLTQVYTDTVPQSYITSLDPNLHRMRHEPLKKDLLENFMVDYVFIQPPYSASNVRLEFGVSDHAAVVATLSKTK